MNANEPRRKGSAVICDPPKVPKERIDAEHLGSFCRITVAKVITHAIQDVYNRLK